MQRIVALVSDFIAASVLEFPSQPQRINPPLSKIEINSSYDSALKVFSSWNFSACWNSDPSPGTRSWRRDHCDWSTYRPCSGNGWRLFLLQEPIQPRHAGRASARLLIQAIRLCLCAWEWLHAINAHHLRRIGTAGSMLFGLARLLSLAQCFRNLF